MEENNSEINDNKFLSRGCKGTPKVYLHNDSAYKNGCCKLDSYDWLKDIDMPGTKSSFDFVEVRFKNSRKEFYKTHPELDLEIGDIVAVEASPGHDIGIVSMVGEIVRLQMIKKKVNYGYNLFLMNYIIQVIIKYWFYIRTCNIGISFGIRDKRKASINNQITKSI